MKALQKILMRVSVICVLTLSAEAATIDSLSKRINKYGQLAQLHLQRAQLHINSKDYKAASLDLHKAVVIDPNLEEAHLFLAEILIDEDEKEAITLLNHLINNTKNKEVHTNASLFLAEAYMQKDNIELALNIYKRLLKNGDLCSSEHYVKMAKAYYEHGEFRQSINVLKRGLSTVIDKKELRNTMVNLSIDEGHYTLAISVLDTMIIENDSEAGLYLKRAEVFKEQGKTKQMQKDMQRATLCLQEKTLKADTSKRLQKKLQNLYASL